MIKHVNLHSLFSTLYLKSAIIWAPLVSSASRFSVQ